MSQSNWLRSDLLYRSMVRMHVFTSPITAITEIVYYDFSFQVERAKSLQELCTSVIVSALLERRALHPDLLWDRLRPYVPPPLRRSITNTYGTLEYHYIPFRAHFRSRSGDNPRPT